MDYLPTLPHSWQAVLGDELGSPYFRALWAFVCQERRAHPVYPPPEDLFAAFRLTPYPAVRVVLLGQDPYHDQGQAHGLCFSVRPGVRPPPSLKNIFKELHSDLGLPIAGHGCLCAWAERGVLLLNTVLTVRAHQAGSHQGQGWERFTDAAIHRLSARPEPLVFVLWGAQARKKLKLIDAVRHKVVEGVHPSPLSAHQGFFGTRPFTQINAALASLGYPALDWRLPPG